MIAFSPRSKKRKSGQQSLLPAGSSPTWDAQHRRMGQSRKVRDGSAALRSSDLSVFPEFPSSAKRVSRDRVFWS